MTNTGTMKRAAIFAAGAMAFAALLPADALAKVTAAEAAKLGKELTPLGAIKAGNADGSIPAWDGGITKPPAGWKPGTVQTDPFPDDKPRFTITPDNVGQHAAKLPEGQVAMFKRYPQTWKMPVYVTRRTAAFPQRIYDASIANATTAELVPGGNGVKNARESAPFPIPQNGQEAIWNHLMRYRFETVSQVYAQAVPTASGDYTMVKIEENVIFPYNMPGGTTENTGNRLIYFLQTTLEPPRLAGEILLVHEPIDQATETRKAWTYNAGLRRVRRAPNVEYDNPGTASDGQRTNDQNGMYNGAIDRYDWTLVGRKEIYVPYNSYKLHSDKVKYTDILKPGHFNPDLLRYELHRVWVVEAKVKPTTSHIYARRTFYIDEDSWQIVHTDNYDARGEIWRVQESHGINYYQIPLFTETAMAVYDLQNGRYLSFGLNNEERASVYNEPMSIEDFTPDSMRSAGRR
jgi:Protein of unknown function (DUF1329)